MTVLPATKHKPSDVACRPRRSYELTQALMLPRPGLLVMGSIILEKTYAEQVLFSGQQLSTKERRTLLESTWMCCRHPEDVLCSDCYRRTGNAETMSP
jgi:hypothetical protein